MGVPTIGLTGNIASGKSTAANMFRDLGIPVVDADRVARDVVAPGSEGLAAVVAAFGEEMLHPDGTLDRQRMADLVFKDADRRSVLNGILHPRIAAESANRLAALQDSGAPYLVYEVPLLFENGLQAAFPITVAVLVDEETQFRRLVARDDFDEAHARARMAAQMPMQEKASLATHVIMNDGDVEQLRQRVGEVHARLLAEET